MLVYCYYVIITFCYKASYSRIKIVKFLIVQVFNWLSRHLIYYLYIDNNSSGLGFPSFNLKNIFIKSMTNK